MKLTPSIQPLALLQSLAFLFAALTGAGTALAVAPAAGASAESAAAPGTTIDWEHMSKADKKKYMKTTVLPAMKTAYQAFDAKRYKKFNCATCHGEGATDGTFKMPNATLPKLPQPTDGAGFVALQQKKPDAVKFMGTVVKPKMAELLGLRQWEPTTQTGFGCYQCHAKAEK
jgi:hypothetical protein